MTEGLNPRDLHHVFGKNSEQKQAEAIYDKFLKSGDSMEKLDELKSMYPEWYNRANDDSNDYLDAVIALIDKFSHIDPKLKPHVEDVILDDMAANNPNA